MSQWWFDGLQVNRSRDQSNIRNGISGLYQNSSHYYSSLSFPGLVQPYSVELWPKTRLIHSFIYPLIISMNFCIRMKTKLYSPQLHPYRCSEIFKVQIHLMLFEYFIQGFSKEMYRIKQYAPSVLIVVLQGFHSNATGSRFTRRCQEVVAKCAESKEVRGRLLTYLRTSVLSMIWWVSNYLQNYGRMCTLVQFWYR